MRAVVDTNVFVSAILKDQSLPALAVHVSHGDGRAEATTASARLRFIQMVLTLARLSFIKRQPGVARSIALLVSPETLPILAPSPSNPLLEVGQSETD